MNKPDLEEFRELILEHEHAVRTCIRVMGIRQGYVDDLAQETFILAYKKFDSYNPEKSLRAWLLSLTKNLVLNERRKNNRRSRLLSEKYSLLVSENYERVVETATEEHDLTILNKCLDKLPENHRQIVQLRYYSEQNSSQIGTIMNKGASSIRHTLRRVLESLKFCVFKERKEAGELS